MDTIYQTLVGAFMQSSVLVIGDLMIDTYLKGASTRLSPEAPVPVVNISSSVSVLGGGANTAVNLRQLGARVTFAGIAGNDPAGRQALELLESAGIINKVICTDTRNTIVKTRVIAGSQLLTRYDEGTEHPVDDDSEMKLIALLEQEFHRHDAVVIADYNKGVITPGVIAALQRLNQARRQFIAVDSKRLECFRALRPSLVKPNYHEITQLLQLPEIQGYRSSQLQDLGPAIYEATGAAVTAITLDAEGALIFMQAEPAYRTFARPVSMPNVAGAGDTYISAFTLASLAGADVACAAEIAGAAAEVAISKTDTACCCQEELFSYFSTSEKYITDLQQLAGICNVYRARGKKIVFTNGCFDILHSGHVSYLNRARELGDVLIVGINTDESIRRLKGRGRPINQLQDRMEVLAGLGVVTHVVPFGSEIDDTPAPLIQLVRPHIFTKGGDYSREDLPEAAMVEQLGGEIVLLPLVPDRSTTSIIRRIHTTPVLKAAEA